MANTTFNPPTQIPQCDVVTTGLANILTEVDVDPRVKKLSFRPRANAAKLTWNGAGKGGTLVAGLADAGALGGAIYLTLPADTWTEVIVQRDLGTSLPGVSILFVTSASAGTEIEIIGEQLGGRANAQ